MALFRKLFQSGGKNKKKEFPNIIQGLDPLERWQKVGELGDGAFGKVYKTEHRDSGKLAAMKRVPIRDESELDDYMVEIDILTECRHKNIVGLYEAYFYDQALWIYIEFCAGGAMDDIIVELDHGLLETQIRCISRQLFEALAFLHSSNCIHRDLKAGNILLCPDGSIRLADFGVSTKDTIKGRQKHNTFIGTPYWMAPEVVMCETIKDDPYDHLADIWSAGITMIELADMNPPYHEMSPMRVLQKIVKKDPPMLAIPSRWSKDFNDIIAKCLMKTPSSRPSAEELLKHPFIASVSVNKPLRILYQEIKSEVEEIVEELPEDADLSTDPGHSQDLISEGTPPAQENSGPPDHSEDQTSPNSDLGPQPVSVLSEEPSPEDAPPSSPVPQHSGHDSVEVGKKAEAVRQDRRSPVLDVSASGEDSDKKEHKYATLSRVRKFKVDGQVIQSTTRKIVDVTANRTLRDNKKYQQMRKEDFRELKQLQREEMKEATEFFTKIKLDREIQEKKFEMENMEIEKHYESELESINKRHKREIEKQENQHIQQFKNRLKYLKTQQSKDLKRFKENLKEEEKLEMKSVEVSVSKEERKVALNTAKLDLQTKRLRKEESFAGKQAKDKESEVRLILKEQKEDRKALELGFLDVKQDLSRNHANMQWEVEQRQKQEHHQLLKQQLREAFHMQRHQMHDRHQMEISLQGRRDQFQLEELRQQQLLEKRQLPKALKTDHRQKVAEARKYNKKPDKDYLKKLDEEYVKMCQLQTELMNEGHEKAMETLRAELDTNMRELLEIQNEKKMQLTQQETNKMKERDEQHTQELRGWRTEISKRKQKLEEVFRSKKAEQEQFYSQDHPIPKQLRSSLSLPGGAGSVRSTKALSIGSFDSTSNPLDVVVMNTPVLNHIDSPDTSPDPPPDTTALQQNGNSS